MIGGMIREVATSLRRVLKKPTLFLYNITVVGTSILTAFVSYKLLIVATNCTTPVVVVLSGSMEPGIYRSDILLISKPETYNVGDVVVYNQNQDAIPIVHRITAMHKEADGRTLILTKGDNNRVNDRALYRAKEWWLDSKDIMGRSYAIIPRLGMPTIWFNEIAYARPILFGLMFVGLMTGKEV